MPEKTMADYRRELEEKQKEEALAKQLEDQANKVSTRTQAGKNLKGSWVGKAAEGAKNNKVPALVKDSVTGFPGARSLLDMYEMFGESDVEGLGRKAVDLSAQSPGDEESTVTWLKTGKGLADLIATFTGMGNVSKAFKIPMALSAGLSSYSAEPNDFSNLAGTAVGLGSNKLLQTNPVLQKLFSIEQNSPSQSAIDKLLDQAGPAGYNFLEGALSQGASNLVSPNPMSVEDMIQGGGINAIFGMAGRGIQNSLRGSAKRTPYWAEQELRKETGKYELPKNLDEDATFLRGLNDTMAAEENKYGILGGFERDKAGEMTKRSMKFELPDEKSLKAMVAARMGPAVDQRLKEMTDKFKASDGYKQGIKNLVAQGKTPEQATAEMDQLATQMVEQMGGRQLLEQDLAGKLRKDSLSDIIKKHNEKVSKFQQEFDEYKTTLSHKDVQIDKINPQTYKTLTTANQKDRYIGLDQTGAIKELSAKEWGKLNPKVQKEYQKVTDIETPYRLTGEAMERALNVRAEAFNKGDAIKTNWAHLYNTNEEYRKIFDETLNSGGANAPGMPTEVQKKVVDLLRATSDTKKFSQTLLENPVNLKAFNYYTKNNPKMVELGKRQLSRAIVQDTFKPPKIGSDNPIGETLFDKLKSLEKQDFEELMGAGSYDRLKDLAEAQKNAWEWVSKTGFDPQAKELAMPMLFFTWGMSQLGAISPSFAAPGGFAAVGAFKAGNAYATKHVHVMQRVLTKDGMLAKALKEYWAAPEKKSRLGAALTRAISTIYEDSPDADAIDKAIGGEKE